MLMKQINLAIHELSIIFTVIYKALWWLTNRWQQPGCYFLVTQKLIWFHLFLVFTTSAPLWQNCYTTWSIFNTRCEKIFVPATFFTSDIFCCRVSGLFTAARNMKYNFMFVLRFYRKRFKQSHTIVTFHIYT